MGVSTSRGPAFWEARDYHLLGSILGGCQSMEATEVEVVLVCTAKRALLC